MTVQTLRMAGDEWWRPIPRGVSRDAKLILTARALRAFADGFVSVLLPVYLLELGFSVIAIGAIVTTTLIGSARLTLWVGIYAHRHKRRLMLIGACVLMAATGAGFALTSQFWPLLIIAFVGTLNPSSGDVSVFLPLEHTVLAQAADPHQRTALFARYSLAGALTGAVGTLAASLPDLAVEHSGMSDLAATQAMFWLYGLIGALVFLLYEPLSAAVEAQAEAPPAPLRQSRRIVYGLAALFSIDSFGSGFFVQSLLVLWLYQAYGLSVATAASILFWSGLLAALSFLLAVPISTRFGLVNTMVFTHLPSNIFVIFVPRSSYVMAVVTPAERPAAASLTAVPRSFASALSPFLASYLLTLSSFGWPLIIGGALKGAYDLLLFLKFRKLRPPEEERIAPSGPA